MGSKQCVGLTSGSHWEYGDLKAHINFDKRLRDLDGSPKSYIRSVGAFASSWTSTAPVASLVDNGLDRLKMPLENRVICGRDTLLISIFTFSCLLLELPLLHPFDRPIPMQLVTLSASALFFNGSPPCN